MTVPPDSGAFTAGSRRVIIATAAVASLILF
jgi:hypothetical protein